MKNRKNFPVQGDLPTDPPCLRWLEETPQTSTLVFFR